MGTALTELKNLLERITQEEYRQPTKPAVMNYNKSKSQAQKLKIQGLTHQLIAETRHNNKTNQLALKISETQNIKEKLQLIEQLTNTITPKRTLQFFPHDIRTEIETDIEEIQKCIENNCLRSAVILCGRVLETALHRKYYEVTGIDLLEKAPGTGLGNIIAKLAEKGIKLDPGLTNQIHLVNQVRVHSVHKKQQTFMPSEQQTQAIVLYTMDILEKLFTQKHS